MGRKCWIATLRQGPCGMRRMSPYPGLLRRCWNDFHLCAGIPIPCFHFPIAFTVSPGLFYLLYLLSGVKGFETTSFFCLGAGILFTVPGVLTGFFTWWLNYQARPLRPVRIKIIFSTVLVTVSLCAFLLRFLFPEAVLSGKGMEMFYLLLLLALIPIVSTIGWFGASLTFPLKRQ